MKLSVIIPTHNPRPDLLASVLAALDAQSLPRADWELLLIDNASSTPPKADIGWHPSARVIVEPELGLTRARLRGFSEARGDVAVLVDDDNVLDPDYLACASSVITSHPFLGTWSGAITLKFDDPAAQPPAIYFQFLTTRRVERATWSNDPGHNDSTPWGAGMCIRREVFEAYIGLVRRDPRRSRLDLQGKALVYGGDTDIAFTGCSLGFGKGVLPSLHLTHLIPAARCDTGNLLRAAEGQAYSEILHGYLMTGRIPKARSDLAGKVGDAVRYLRADSDERKIMAARRRGYGRARSELGKESAPQP
jgi:hypothetical protein